MFINCLGSFAVCVSFVFRLWPVFVKYLLNWSTITFLSVQLFPLDVMNVLLTTDFLFLDFKISCYGTPCFLAIIFKFFKICFPR